MRRLSGLVAALALASCFGRVSAWAAPAGNTHACCTGEAPAKVPVVAECCATTAAVAAPQVPAPDLIEIAVPSLSIPASSIHFITDDSGVPPWPQTFRAASPARAPPPAA